MVASLAADDFGASLALIIVVENSLCMHNCNVMVTTRFPCTQGPRARHVLSVSDFGDFALEVVNLVRESCKPDSHIGNAW